MFLFCFVFVFVCCFFFPFSIEIATLKFRVKLTEILRYTLCYFLRLNHIIQCPFNIRIIVSYITCCSVVVLISSEASYIIMSFFLPFFFFFILSEDLLLYFFQGDNLREAAKVFSSYRVLRKR